MSKLSKIMESLEIDTDIKVVEIRKKDLFPGKSGYWRQDVDIFAVPRNGTIEIEKLKKIRDQLVPSLEPNCKYDFETEDGTWLLVLFFDENIGKRLILEKITFNKEEIDLPSSERPIVKEIEEIKRLIWLGLFQDIKTARSATRLGDKYEITRKKA